MQSLNKTVDRELKGKKKRPHDFTCLKRQRHTDTSPPVIIQQQTVGEKKKKVLVCLYFCLKETNRECFFFSEEKIHHQILSKITSEQGLIPWKHKIANEIIADGGKLRISSTIFFFR